MRAVTALDMIEGALEGAEITYASALSYCDGWAYLHPDDQSEFLVLYAATETNIRQLHDWRAAGRLDHDHLGRFERILAFKAEADPRIRALEPPRAPASSQGHPMVLDD